MKRSYLAVFAFLAAITLALGSVVAQQQDVEAVEDVMQQYEERVNAGDAAGVAALFTENSIYYTAVGQVIEGREALQEAYQGAIDAGVTELSLETIETEVLYVTAYHTGSYTLVTPEGELLEGYYMAIINREDEWRIHRLVTNMAMPEEEMNAGDEQAVDEPPPAPRGAFVEPTELVGRTAPPTIPGPGA
jgi:uncharacterized protein (TIGR02246 family)